MGFFEIFSIEGATPKLGLEQVPYGLTEFNAAISANMDILDAKISTYLEGTSGEALAAYTAVYQKSDGKMWRAKADSVVTMPAAGLIVSAVAGSGLAVLFQRIGSMTNPAWNWAVGGAAGLIYLSPTVSGGLTQTRPTNGRAQIVAVALAPTTIFVWIHPTWK